MWRKASPKFRLHCIIGVLLVACCAAVVAAGALLSAPGGAAWKYSALAGLFVLPAAFFLARRPLSVLCRPLERSARFAGRPAAEGAPGEPLPSARALNGPPDKPDRPDKPAASRNALLDVLDGLDALILVSDPDDGAVLFMNDRLRRLLGLSGDPAGKKLGEVLPPDLSGPRPAAAACAEDSGPDGGAPFRWEGKNAASGRCYSVIERRIGWSDCGKRAWLQQAIDVTARAEAERRALRQRDQQAMLTDIARDCLVSGDPDGLALEILRRVGEFTGARRLFLARRQAGSGEFSIEREWRAPAGERRDETAAAEAADALFRSFAEREASAAAGPEVFRYPETPRPGEPVFYGAPLLIGQSCWGGLALETAPDGPDAWGDNDDSLLFLTAGLLSHFIARHGSEKKLLLLSAIAASSPGFICYLDGRGDYVYVNAATEAMTGYTAGELLSGEISLLRPGDSFERLEREVRPFLERNKVARVELPLVRKDGEVRVFDLYAFRTKPDEPGFGFVGHDVTEQRRLRDELVAAKELAEKSSRAKSEFLSNMSHEIRTPLNAIVGMTNIGRASDSEEKKEYCLEKIETASLHLMGVLNDILDMSKIEADKFELAPAEFVFEKMLQRIISVLQFSMDQKRQTLSVRVSANTPFSLVADEQRLGQVLANLLSNAVKFTPEHGGISLDITTLEEDGGEVLLEARVTDTGIGIPAAALARLFRPFEQAENGISRKFGGTGLGLAISRHIVERMGGGIRVESEPGRGSAFTFTVRAGRGRISRRQSLPAEVDWSKVRLLAVDDEPDVREYFHEFARSAGLACDTADSAESALELLEKNGAAVYSALFIDWRLPGADGLELTRRLTARYGDQPVVIMISGADRWELESAALAAGARKFLPKPLFSSQILDCLTACLDLERREPAGARPVESLAGAFAGRRVLLAEDIEINREIVISLLEDTGLAIECAENGARACELFRADPGRYDLIFMDVHMPEVDGYEATRRIRALGTAEAAAVPIVAMTANAFQEDVALCLAAGMNDHLAKPIDLDNVLDKLRKYLA